TVLISRAPELKSRAWAIFAVFPPLVWLLIGISTLLIGPIAALISCLMQAYRKDDPPPQGLNLYTFSLFRNLVIQGNPIETHYWALRFLFFCWYFFCLIIF
ncbi:unnamed protein product, partial [Meganyctiphanes norvegica]